MRGMWKVAVGLATATAALGTAAVGWAMIPDENGVIHGCYVRSGGALRVIDAGVTNCRSTETSLNWNQMGPAGPAGGLSGYAIVSELSAFDSDGEKDVVIACPAGKVVVGGGAEINSGETIAALTNPEITQSIPFGDGGGWSARAEEQGLGVLGAWDFEVRAICVDGP